MWRRAASGGIFIIHSPPSRFICPLSPRGRATFRLSRARILLNVNQMFNRRIPDFDPETLRLMQRYPCPGNIRELHNEIQRMAVFRDGDTSPRPALAAHPRP
jgi:two-component system response regulator HupR/HoxA